MDDASHPVSGWSRLRKYRARLGSLCLLLTVLDVLVEHHLLPVMAAGVASILLTAVFAYALLKLTVYKDLETKSS